MSIEPEDVLEEALRADLPSKDAETRLRRRLLGAGLAVGHGVAATTAAAAGGAGSGAKVAALSWGLKLGLAAAVAIPTGGLLWEHSQAPSRQAPPSALARSTRPSVAARPPAAVRAPAALVVAPEPPAESPLKTPRGRSSVRHEAASPPTFVAAPSQTEFALAEPPPSREESAFSTLGEETRLLDRAFAELAAGNRAEAVRLVAEHERRYPRGLLVKERERVKTKLSE